MSWESITLIILGVLILIAGGYIRKLVKEFKEFFDVCHDALRDGSISPEELAYIIKEAKDIKTAVIDIVNALNK